MVPGNELSESDLMGDGHQVIVVKVPRVCDAWQGKHEEEQPCAGNKEPVGALEHHAALRGVADK
ncbi:hypothetical protein EV182_003172, partial [Spiromyces aspiralis]